MTHYFWLVHPESEKLKKDYKKTISHDFGGRSARHLPLDTVRLVYLNGDGKPVIASCTTETPEHRMGFKNVELVGQAESVVCLVNAIGFVEQPGYDYCFKRGIKPTAGSIFMEAGNWISSFLPGVNNDENIPSGTIPAKKK